MGAEPPLYAHLPLLHGPDGKKLSKRHGAASVQDLRDRGLPARGGAQLPRAAGLGLRRDDDVLHHRGAAASCSRSSASRSRPRSSTSRSCAGSTAATCASSPLDDLTARLEALTGRDGPARRGRDHAGEDLDARRVLAAGAARSSTVRSTTRRRARSSSAPGGAREALDATRARRSPSVPGAVERRERSRRRCAASSSAPGRKAEAGLPAVARRARPERPSHPVSSRPSRCSGATRPWRGSTLRSTASRRG